MVINPNPFFLEAISVFGSQAAMARAIGKPVQLINQIKKGARPMPDGWAPLIEEKTAALGHPVMCETLAPAVNWGYLRSTERRLLPTSAVPELIRPTTLVGQEVTHG